MDVYTGDYEIGDVMRMPPAASTRPAMTWAVRVGYPTPYVWLSTRPESMIRGRVTADITPIIRLEVLDGLGRSMPVAAVLDTGFNGDVSLPIPTMQPA